METLNEEDLVELTPVEAVTLGSKNLITYGRIFFPKTFRQESPEFHYDIGEKLYLPVRQQSVEVFRDGAKTTLLRTFLSQRVAYAISRTVLVVSASLGHSVLTIRWLKRQVEYNRKWAETFRLRKGSRWSDETGIEIVNEIEGISTTIVPLGITGQLRGFNIDDHRPDLIIADDCSTDEATNTPEQRAKMENLFFGALINSLAPETEAPLAKVVLLDTPKNKFDLIESTASRPDWQFTRYGILDENNKSRWEARYPTEKVLQSKAAHFAAGLGEIWMREKECKIISSELASFNSGNLKYYDLIPEGLTTIISIDPASSDSKDADDQVAMVIGFRGPDVYVLDYTAEKGENPDALCATLFEFIRLYRPMAIVSESTAYQRTLAWYIEKEMRERKIWVTVHKIDDRRRKADRIIQALGGLSAFGKLHVKASQTELITQFTEYSPHYRGHDDILDALSQGVHWGETKHIASYIDGEYSVVEDDNYRELEFRSCP